MLWVLAGSSLLAFAGGIVFNERASIIAFLTCTLLSFSLGFVVWVFSELAVSPGSISDRHAVDALCQAMTEARFSWGPQILVWRYVGRVRRRSKTARCFKKRLELIQVSSIGPGFSIDASGPQYLPPSWQLPGLPAAQPQHDNILVMPRPYYGGQAYLPEGSEGMEEGIEDEDDADLSNEDASTDSTANTEDNLLAARPAPTLPHWTKGTRPGRSKRSSSVPAALDGLRSPPIAVVAGTDRVGPGPTTAPSTNGLRFVSPPSIRPLVYSHPFLSPFTDDLSIPTTGASFPSSAAPPFHRTPLSSPDGIIGTDLGQAMSRHTKVAGATGPAICDPPFRDLPLSTADAFL